VHVVVVGREKVVPALEDAATVLQLLPPSATGQRATSYVTWITGPSAPGAELHIIVLDNGRERMRADPQFSDALRCIKCGACSTVCPSFGVVGGHVFGYVYSGAIGLVNTPFHHGLEEDAGPLSLCVSCNACQTVCPVDIPLPRQILDHRARLVEATGLPLQERLILEIWSRPRVFRSLARIGAVLQRPLQREGHISVPFSPGRTARRAPPALASRPFRDTLPRLTPPLPGALGATLSGVRVAFFIQCLTDWLCPEIAGAVVDVLRSLGATVVVPQAQHCCGLPALDGGDRARARSMARHTIAALESAGADYVVTGGTSCAIAIMSDYERLFDGDAKWERRGRELARRTLDFTSFMDRVVKLPAGALGPVGRGGMPERQTAYHHFCQAHNVLGNRDEPLRLLGEVCGLELAPLPEANWCCGFGGSVSLNRPGISEGILERKLDNVDRSGARVLVTDNPGCIMHLRSGIRASSRNVAVRHIAEVIAERIRARRAAVS
jgi:Fe-S oxidoreductase